jgi:HK97 gp10 family phage protein
MRVRFETRGFKELDAELARIEKRASAKGTLRRALTKAAEPMRDAIRMAAPVKTGKLRESIKISPRANLGRMRLTKKGNLTQAKSKQQREAFGHIVEVFIGVDASVEPHSAPGRYDGVATYSAVIEFGKHNIPPVAMFRKGWDGGKDQVIEDLARELEDEIKKTIGRQQAKKARMKK